MTDKQPKPRDKYWICSDCAKAKGWKYPTWSVTGIFGICGWCEKPEQEALIPVVDFKRPGRVQVWD